MKHINGSISLFFTISLITASIACNLVSANKNNSSSNDSLSVSEKSANANAENELPDSLIKHIYLTFDDGPQHGTVAVADLCRQLHTKASFFMVGMHTQAKSDGFKIVDSIKKSYPLFLLANHSYSHAYSKYKYFYHHPQTAFEDFIKNQQLLSVPYKIIRLPGNRAWNTGNGMKASSLVEPVCRLLDSAGYNIIGWDAEWSFNHKTVNPVQSVDKMKEIIDSAFIKNETHTKNHLVLLAHDRMFRSPQYLDSLSKLIQQLHTNKFYRFETVDHYPQLKPLSN